MTNFEPYLSTQLLEVDYSEVERRVVTYVGGNLSGPRALLAACKAIDVAASRNRRVSRLTQNGTKDPRKLRRARNIKHTMTREYRLYNYGMYRQHHDN